jgi:hypothetical protein
MRTWPDVRPISSFWKKPSGEGADALARRPLATLAGDQNRSNRIAFPASVLAFLPDDRGSGKEEITWLTMHVVSNTSHAPGEPWRHRHNACSPAVRRMDANSARAGPEHRCRNWSGRLLSREQKPAGSSTEARGSQWSGQGIRWRLCRGCA